MYIHLIVLFTAGFTSALNVLVWSPTYGQSHVNFMGNIADLLANDGHNVTMMLVANDRDVRSTGTKLVRNILHYSSPLVSKDEWTNLHFKKANIFHLQTFELSDYLKMENINLRICQGMLNDELLLDVLKEANFDVLVLEMFHFCPAGIAHLLKIEKIVLASALGMTTFHYELTGLPISLSNTPAFLSEHGSRMSFTERLHNVLYYFVQKVLYWRMYYSEQSLFARKFLKFPDLFQLYKQKTDYILLNTNEFTDPPKPLPPNVKYIGGSNIGQPRTLSQKFEKILSNAKRGAVIFSLGSIVKAGEMPISIRRAFLDAFRLLPDYQFLWKDDLQLSNSSDVPENVHFIKWLPQVDLLADTRIKAFITHGGMNSIQESLFFGVPMIVMPIFADQDGNAALAQERGYALRLSKFHLTKEAVVTALTRILGHNGVESSFTTKARQASRILKHSPAQMKDEILRAVLLSGQGKHLQINTDLSLLQYYNLDVYLYIFLVLVTFCILLIWLFKVFIDSAEILKKKNL